MSLTENNIHHYLLRKKYIELVLFIQGQYKVEVASSRNTLFKIHQLLGQSLFVKQSTDSNPQNAYLMQKEAAIHRIFEEVEEYEQVVKYIPKLLGYDVQNQILVTQLFPHAKSLLEVIQEQKKFTTNQAKTIASILNSFHPAILEKLKNTPSLKFFNQQLPWILATDGLHQLAQQSQNPTVQYILQTPDLLNGLDQIKTNWKMTSLIHGDIKWVNFVVTTEGDLKLIDWEIANIGDPLWDVGGLFQSYLSSWVFSFDGNNSWNFQKLKGQEFITIDAIQTGIQAFWKTYVQLQKYSPEEAHQALLTSTKMAAARLLQTAFEANQQPQLLPNTVRILQLSQQLFNHPKQAIQELFGLTTSFYEKQRN